MTTEKRTLGNKFASEIEFINYIKKTYDLVTVGDIKLKDFFANNKDMLFSNTGLLKAVKAL